MPLGAAYVDAGATATDEEDGDLTAAIRVSNPVDTSVAGDYTVSYDVTDSDGNAAATRTRIVRVSADDEVAAPTESAGQKKKDRREALEVLRHGATHEWMQKHSKAAVPRKQLPL